MTTQASLLSELYLEHPRIKSIHDTRHRVVGWAGNMTGQKGYETSERTCYIMKAEDIICPHR